MTMVVTKQSAVATSIDHPDQLDALERRSMLDLMMVYYDNVREDVFQRDLNAKDWVIRLRCQQTGRLIGFSTQRLLRQTINDQLIRVLFSGDTIVDRNFWNSPKLAQTWGRFVLRLIAQAQDEPLYWLLLSKGYRSYRFLPLFFRRYLPALHETTSTDLEQVRRAFAKRLYGDAFDSATSVVRGEAIDNYRLHEGVAEVTAARCQDPHVRFFLTLNPGHFAGDELCCVAPLERDNFTLAARRVIGREYF